MAAIFLPVAFGAALWKHARAGLRSYFVVSILGAIGLLMGVLPLDRQLYEGLWQRLLALAVFPPVGIGSYVLLRRVVATRAAYNGIKPSDLAA